MSDTPEETDRDQNADTAMDAWVGREAEDIPPGWMDNVVKRLLEQMNRQLVRAETAKEDEKNTPETRDLNSRSLVRLELMLERLIRFETQRARTRATTKASHEGALEEFKRRIDRLVEARGTGAASGDPER